MTPVSQWGGKCDFNRCYCYSNKNPSLNDLTGSFYLFSLIFSRRRNLPPKNKICKILLVPLSGTKNLKSSFSLPLQGEVGGRGVRGEFRPPSPLMKSVRIFSNTHRQLEKERFACPSVVRQLTDEGGMS